MARQPNLHYDHAIRLFKSNIKDSWPLNVRILNSYYPVNLTAAMKAFKLKSGTTLSRAFRTVHKAGLERRRYEIRRAPACPPGERTRSGLL